ncbi:GPP34 family phosphoprotein [Actinacidiphila alni]|uniref:GPP34 family phosphoprotein n=1 Tax=Actinacidiphila alni TaxID=380248 RepID=UPI003457251F
MTTARDLIVVAMDVPADLLVDRGDLSLALAAAELIDLLAARALALRGDLVVPGERRDEGQGTEAGRDRLLTQALTAYEAATRPGTAGDRRPEGDAAGAGDTGRAPAGSGQHAEDEETGERVEDWLWRRGRDLPTAYLAALEEEGTLVREDQRRWRLLPTSRRVLADTPGRRRAAQHWSSDAPVLRALGTLIGVKGEEPPPDEVPEHSPARVVVDGLRQAVDELAEERRLRTTRLDRANATYRSRGY